MNTIVCTVSRIGYSTISGPHQITININIVVLTSKLTGKTVKFGATVKLIDEDTEEEKTYQIVGEDEADIKAGKISVNSPIARGLIGKEVDDVALIKTPAGDVEYEILEVQYL